MICKIQVVTIGEDGHKETREITSIQRTDVKPETMGLTLAEGKMILKDLQQVVVESQVCSGADGRRTILFRRGLPAELGRNFRLPMVPLPSGSMVAMSAGGTRKDSSR